MIEKLLDFPLVPGGLLCTWLLLEALALRRLRREQRQAQPLAETTAMPAPGASSPGARG